MAKQYLIPGKGYICDGESGVQRLFAGVGILTDATPPPVVGRAAVTLADAARPSFASVNAKQYFARGMLYFNDVGLGAARPIPGLGTVDEVPAPQTSISGTATILLDDFTAVGGIISYTGTAAVTLDDFVGAATGGQAASGTAAVTLNGVYPYAFGGDAALARSGMVALSASIRSMGELV